MGKHKEYDYQDSVQPQLKTRIRGTYFKSRYERWAKQTVDDLARLTPIEADFKVRIEPESHNKPVYLVSIHAHCDGEDYIVEKKGRQIYKLLQQSKRVLAKILRRQKGRKTHKLRERTPIARLPVKYSEVS